MGNIFEDKGSWSPEPKQPQPPAGKRHDPIQDTRDVERTLMVPGEDRDWPSARMPTPNLSVVNLKPVNRGKHY